MAKGKAVTAEWNNVPLNEIAPSVRSVAERSIDMKVSRLLLNAKVC